MYLLQHRCKIRLHFKAAYTAVYDGGTNRFGRSFFKAAYTAVYSVTVSGSDGIDFKAAYTAVYMHLFSLTLNHLFKAAYTAVESTPSTPFCSGNHHHGTHFFHH